MFALVAALLVLTATPQSASTAVPAPAAPPAAVDALREPVFASPLPGAPRGVKLTLTSEGSVVTWRRPATTGASELTGYIVVADGNPIQVDASTRRVTLPGVPAQVGVAAMNDVGCSVASPAAGLGLVASRPAPETVSSLGR